MNAFLNALWHDALGASVGFTVGFLLRDYIGRPFRRYWQEHVDNQHALLDSQAEISDKLSLDTPGGIGDLPAVLSSVLDERDGRD